MEIIRGKSVSKGMTHGRIMLLRQNRIESKTNSKTTPEKEITRFRKACQQLSEELNTLYEKTKTKVGEEEAEIFSAHQMMLEAEEFTEAAEKKIKNGSQANTAVLETGETLAAQFAAMESAYMQERAADIRSVAGRLADILEGREKLIMQTKVPVILAAEDLTPAQTMELDLTKVLGFVTEQGSVNSHTAILARTLNLPAVAAVGYLPETINGKDAVLDGKNGILYVDPDEEIMGRYRTEAENEKKNGKFLDSLRGKTCTTADGRQIRICANAGSIQDVKAAAEADAEGIGLFRSEFLFMQYDRCPTEEEQYCVYREVLETMPGAEVVIRTLDAGADKQIHWLTHGIRENNPALGLRAVRICLQNPNLLHVQLRALYRAAAHGKICAMIPMITLPEELDQVHAIAGRARESLQSEGILYNPDMPIGIMIETPAAALSAGILAEKAAFFSLGTNDLTQYTMAADRENASVAYLTEHLTDSVKKLIRMTTDAAGNAGIPVSVCGELAANQAAIPFLLEAGVTKLSVSPGQILKVRHKVMQVLEAEIN